MTTETAAILEISPDGVDQGSAFPERPVQRVQPAQWHRAGWNRSRLQIEEEAEEAAGGARRLKEAEQQTRLAQLVASLLEPGESPAFVSAFQPGAALLERLAPIFRRGGQGRGHGAGRGPADVAETVLILEAEDRGRVNDPARDPALHDQITL